MNKVVVTMLSIIAIIGAVFTAVTINKTQKNEIQENVVEKISDSEILDDCTDEYEMMEKNNIIQTNSEEEKTSPNCFITIKKHYTTCGHTTSEYLELPKELVNNTKRQIQEKYSEYEIEKFESNEIILYRNMNGECGEHYIVRDKAGQVVIYNIQKDGTEEEYEVTGITTQYLTETDRINMEKGIKVNGKQNLNQLIEDFE